MAMMDPPSNFIFENNPPTLPNIFCKNKTFCFSKAILSIEKPFCKNRVSRRVIKIKEGNAGIVYSINSYYLCSKQVRKILKTSREVANAPRLAFVHR